MDGGAWWAAVHEVAKSRTRLSNFTGDLRELPRVPLRGEGSCGGGGAPRDSAGSGGKAPGLGPHRRDPIIALGVGWQQGWDGSGGEKSGSGSSGSNSRASQ